MNAFRMYAPSSASRAPRTSSRARSKNRKSSSVNSGISSPTSTTADRISTQEGIGEAFASPSDTDVARKTSLLHRLSSMDAQQDAAGTSAPHTNGKATHRRRRSSDVRTGGGARGSEESGRPTASREPRPSFASTTPTVRSTDGHTDLDLPPFAHSRVPVSPSPHSPASKTKLVYLPRGTRTPSSPMGTAAIASARLSESTAAALPGSRTKLDALHEAVTARLPPSSSVTTRGALSSYAATHRRFSDTAPTTSRSTVQSPGRNASSSRRRLSPTSHKNDSSTGGAGKADALRTVAPNSVNLTGQTAGASSGERVDAATSNAHLQPLTSSLAPPAPTTEGTDNTRRHRATPEQVQEVIARAQQLYGLQVTVGERTKPESPKRKAPDGAKASPAALRKGRSASPASSVPVPPPMRETTEVSLPAVLSAQGSSSLSAVPQPPAAPTQGHELRRSRTTDQTLLDLADLKESLSSLPVLGGHCPSQGSSVRSLSMDSHRSTSDRSRAQEPLVPIATGRGAPASAQHRHAPQVRSATVSSRSEVTSLTDAPPLTKSLIENIEQYSRASVLGAKEAVVEQSTPHKPAASSSATFWAPSTAATGALSSSVAFGRKVLPSTSLPAEQTAEAAVGSSRAAESTTVPAHTHRAPEHTGEACAASSRDSSCHHVHARSSPPSQPPANALGNSTSTSHSSSRRIQRSPPVQPLVASVAVTQTTGGSSSSRSSCATQSLKDITARPPVALTQHQSQALCRPSTSLSPLQSPPIFDAVQLQAVLPIDSHENHGTPVLPSTVPSQHESSMLNCTASMSSPALPNMAALLVPYPREHSRDSATLRAAAAAAAATVSAASSAAPALTGAANAQETEVSRKISSSTHSHLSNASTNTATTRESFSSGVAASSNGSADGPPALTVPPTRVLSWQTLGVVASTSADVNAPSGTSGKTTALTASSGMPFSGAAVKPPYMTARSSCSLTSHTSHDGLGPSVYQPSMLSSTALYSSRVISHPTPRAVGSRSTATNHAGITTGVAVPVDSGSHPGLASTPLTERLDSNAEIAVVTVDASAVGLPTLLPANSTSPVTDGNAATFPLGAGAAHRGTQNHHNRPPIARHVARAVASRSPSTLSPPQTLPPPPQQQVLVTPSAIAGADSVTSMVSGSGTALTSLDDLMRVEDAPKLPLAAVPTFRPHDEESSDDSSAPAVPSIASAGAGAHHLLPSSTMLFSSVGSAATLPPGDTDSLKSLKRRGPTTHRGPTRSSRTVSSMTHQSVSRLQYSACDDVSVSDDGDQYLSGEPRRTSAMECRNRWPSFSNTVMLGTPSETMKLQQSQRDSYSMASSASISSTPQSRRSFDRLTVHAGTVIAAGDWRALPAPAAAATIASAMPGEGGADDKDPATTPLATSEALADNNNTNERRSSSLDEAASGTTTTTVSTDLDSEWTTLPLNSAQTDAFFSAPVPHRTGLGAAGHMTSSRVADVQLPNSPTPDALDCDLHEYRGDVSPNAGPPPPPTQQTQQGPLPSILVGASLFRPPSARLTAAAVRPTSATSSCALHATTARLTSRQGSPDSEPLIHFIDFTAKDVHSTGQDGHTTSTGTAEHVGGGLTSVGAHGRPSTGAGSAGNTNRGVTPSFVDDVASGEPANANSEFSPHGFPGGNSGIGGGAALAHSMSLISRASLYCPTFPDVFLDSGTSVNSWRTSPSSGGPLRPASHPLSASEMVEGGMGIRLGQANSSAICGHGGPSDNTSSASGAATPFSDNGSRRGSSPSFVLRGDDWTAPDAQRSLSLTALGQALLRMTSPTSPNRLPCADSGLLALGVRERGGADVTPPPLFVGQGQLMIDYMTAWQNRQQTSDHPTSALAVPASTARAVGTGSRGAAPSEGVWRPTAGFPFVGTAPEHRSHDSRAYSLFSDVVSTHEKLDDEPWWASSSHTADNADVLPPYTVDLDAAQDVLNRWTSHAETHTAIDVHMETPVNDSFALAKERAEAVPEVYDGQDDVTAGPMTALSKLMASMGTAPVAATPGGSVNTTGRLGSAGGTRANPRIGHDTGRGFRSIFRDMVGDDCDASVSFSPGTLIDGVELGGGPGIGSSSGGRGNGFFSLLAQTSSGHYVGGASELRSGHQNHSVGGSRAHANSTSRSMSNSQSGGPKCPYNATLPAAHSAMSALQRHRQSSSSSSSGSRTTPRILSRLGASLKTGLSGTLVSGSTTGFGFQRGSQCSAGAASQRGSIAPNANPSPHSGEVPLTSANTTTVLSEEGSSLLLTSRDGGNSVGTLGHVETATCGAASSGVNGVGVGGEASLRMRDGSVGRSPSSGKHGFRKRQSTIGAEKTHGLARSSAAGTGPPSRRSGAVVQLKEPSPSGTPFLSEVGIAKPVEGMSFSSPLTTTTTITPNTPKTDESRALRSSESNSSNSTSDVPHAALCLSSCPSGSGKKTSQGALASLDGVLTGTKLLISGSVGSTAGSETGNVGASSPTTATATVPSPNYGPNNKLRRFRSGRTLSSNSVTTTSLSGRSSPGVAPTTANTAAAAATASPTRRDSASDVSGPGGALEHVFASRHSSRVTAQTSAMAPPSVTVTSPQVSPRDDDESGRDGADCGGYHLRDNRFRSGATSPDIDCHDGNENTVSSPLLGDRYAAMNPNFIGTMNPLMSFMSPDDRGPDFLIAASEPHSMLLLPGAMESSGKGSLVISEAEDDGDGNGSGGDYGRGATQEKKWPKHGSGQSESSAAGAPVPACTGGMTTIAADAVGADTAFKEDDPASPNVNPSWITHSPGTSSVSASSGGRRNPKAGSAVAVNNSSHSTRAFKNSTGGSLDGPVQRGILSSPMTSSADANHSHLSSAPLAGGVLSLPPAADALGLSTSDHPNGAGASAVTMKHTTPLGSRRPSDPHVLAVPRGSASPSVVPAPPPTTTTSTASKSVTAAAASNVSPRQSIGQTDFSMLLHKFNCPGGVNDHSIFGDLLPSVCLSTTSLQASASPASSDLAPLPVSATAAHLSVSSSPRSIAGTSPWQPQPQQQPRAVTTTPLKPANVASEVERTPKWRFLDSRMGSHNGMGTGAPVGSAVMMNFPSPLQVSLMGDGPTGMSTLATCSDESGLVTSTDQSLSSVIPSFLYAPRELQGELKRRGWTTMLRHLGSGGADPRRAPHRNASHGADSSGNSGATATTSNPAPTTSASMSSTPRGASLSAVLSADAAAAPESAVLAMRTTTLCDLLGLEPVAAVDGRTHKIRHAGLSGPTNGAGRRRLNGGASREQSSIFFGVSRSNIGSSREISAAATSTTVVRPSLTPSSQPATRASPMAPPAMVCRMRSDTDAGVLEEERASTQYLQLPSRRFLSRGQTTTNTATGVSMSGGSLASGFSNNNSFSHSSILLHSDFNWKSDEHTAGASDTPASAKATMALGSVFANTAASPFEPGRGHKSTVPERAGTLPDAANATLLSAISPETSVGAKMKSSPPAAAMAGSGTAPGGDHAHTRTLTAHAVATTHPTVATGNLSPALRDTPHGLCLVSPSGLRPRTTASVSLAGSGSGFGRHPSPLFHDAVEISLRSPALTPESSPPPTMVAPGVSLDDTHLLGTPTVASSAQSDVVVATTPGQSTTNRVRHDAVDTNDSLQSDNIDRAACADRLLSQLAPSSSIADEASTRAVGTTMLEAARTSSSSAQPRQNPKGQPSHKSRKSSTASRRGTGPSGGKAHKGPSGGGSSRGGSAGARTAPNARCGGGGEAVKSNPRRVSDTPSHTNILLSPPFLPFPDLALSSPNGPPLVAVAGSAPPNLAERQDSSTSVSPVPHSPLTGAHPEGDSQRLRPVPPPPAAPSNTLNPRVSHGRDSTATPSALSLSYAPAFSAETAGDNNASALTAGQPGCHTNSWATAASSTSHSSTSLTLPLLNSPCSIHEGVTSPQNGDVPSTS